MVALYPLMFKPIYKPKLWGGGRFATLLNREVPASTHLGESWEIADRPGDVSVVADGDLAGMPLSELRQAYPRELFGEMAGECRDRFPLLLKFIDAEANLSLQVHPDNRFALRHENDLGKNEAWFVMEASPGAKITRGFRAGATPDKIMRAIQQKRLEQLVETFDVAKGETIFIPAGTLHGIGGGLMLAEIQQNSNVTYRVYDYDRSDHHGHKRELQIDKALQVLSFKDIGAPKLKAVKVEPLHYRLVLCDHFSLYQYVYREPIHEYSIERFRILCNIEGHGTIISPEGMFEDIEYHPGTTILIPASVTDFSLVPATHCVTLDIIPGKMLLKKGRKPAPLA